MADASDIDNTLTHCPVCSAPQPQHLITVDAKDYWACATCQARFLDPTHFPTREQERAHYALHENDPDDPGYRTFLSKLATPLLAKMPPKQQILDYGAGPGPALAAVLTEAGHDVTVYDPVYAPNTNVLAATYDAVTCTETAEHFHKPALEFARLVKLVRPGGSLAIMTCFQTDDTKFSNWHYRKDPTHVVFYRAQTFQVISAQFGWHCESPTKDVVLMQKPPA